MPMQPSRRVAFAGGVLLMAAITIASFNSQMKSMQSLSEFTKADETNDIPARANDGHDATSITANKNPISSQSSLAPSPSSSSSASLSSTPFTCHLHARNNTISPSQYGHLPTPIINLGMPKMGSTSLQSFFRCGKFYTSHYECKNEFGLQFCADCMKHVISSSSQKEQNSHLSFSSSPKKTPSIPLLASCGNYQVYTQMDNGSFFPQIEYLQQIHDESPNATFVLTWRNLTSWYRSVDNWPPHAKQLKPWMVMSTRIKNANITGFPLSSSELAKEEGSGGGGGTNRTYKYNVDGHDEDLFAQWFCSHVQRVRDFVTKHPSHALVEIDIEEMGLGERLGNIFGVNESCWGQANVNPVLEKRKIDAATSSLSSPLPIPHDKSCFIARKNTIPTTHYGQLPKPFLNVGMPKMGSSTLHSFFQCGKVHSSHYTCGSNPTMFCRKCISNAIKEGKPPLESCGNFEAYMQMDDGSNLPQISHLKELHEENPNATFVLSFRPTSDWYRSITNWPPKRRIPLMSERLKKSDIPGFPRGKGENETEFSEWFCNHVENIREFVAQHPSHALIEVDIMDDDAGKYMGEVFGIEEGCWGHANANPNLIKVGEEKGDNDHAQNRTE